MEQDRANYHIVNTTERPKGGSRTRSTQSLERDNYGGAPWKDLPQRYPPYQTCHRRFQQWVRLGVFRRIVQELAEDLHERGKIDIREAFIDGSFAPAKKGGLAVGKTKRGSEGIS